MAWDATGTGRSVLKAGYGYFIPELSIAGNYNLNDSFENRYFWHDLNGNLDYDPGEVDFVTDLIDSGNPARRQLNPDLKLGYVHEATASFEQELPGTSAFRVLYLYRRLGNQSGFENVGRPFEAYSIPYEVRDPGPDGRQGTADDGGMLTIYDYPAEFAGEAFETELRVNRPPGRVDWNQSFEVMFNKRMTSRWSMFTSFTGTRIVAHDTDIVNNPNAELFELEDIWSWKFKLNGNVLLPGDVSLGAIIDVQSGFPNVRTVRYRLPQSGNVTVRVEPFGSQREEIQPTLNLRASRRFDTAGGQFVNISFDVLNAMNASAIKNGRYRSGSTFGLVTDFMVPRQFRVGVTYAF